MTKIIDKKDRNKDRVYEFDTLGRLIKAKGGAATGASATANWTQDYTFDRYGNKLTTSKTGYTANYQAIPLVSLLKENLCHNVSSQLSILIMPLLETHQLKD